MQKIVPVWGLFILIGLFLEPFGQTILTQILALAIIIMTPFVLLTSITSSK